ncbi:helix-turn-helix domain-containing protein (plasmid) [Mesorhizobium sp. B1-1-8]|nr:helix-turn-helix domain-containing protein [Mesorhizobium sp. B1-1-8]
MDPVQCRMARAGIRELAEAAQVATQTITRLEQGDRLKPKTLQAIRAAFEAAGIEFLAENGGGPGVRLAKRH